MKRLIVLITLCAVFTACKDKSAANENKIDTTAKLDFPFTPKHPVNWQKGDDKNALIVLNCLKKYVAGDVKGAAENFADTSVFISDGFYFKGKRDSLVTLLSEERDNMVILSKTFDAWTTSYDPDTKQSSVRLWYVEKWTDKKGKQDSLYYTDDVLLKNGKILVYDEKVRHYPAPEPGK